MSTRNCYKSSSSKGFSLNTSDHIPSFWSDIGFQIEITEDGSPTLRIVQPRSTENSFTNEGSGQIISAQLASNQLTSNLMTLADKSSYGPRRPESMHHSGGAFSETDLIYGSVIREVLEKFVSPQFAVVGLGLGYIEMLIAAESLRMNRSVQKVFSFETVAGLVEGFKSWVLSEAQKNQITETYEHILELTSKQTRQPKDEIKNTLSLWLQQDKLIFPGGLNLDWVATHEYSFQGILYDAFSSQTTSELWTEEFLKFLLKKNKSENCIFSTYACLGNLKRALVHNQFQVEVLPGFKGKRNSTRARRLQG